jgi:hypothetical protein
MSNEQVYTLVPSTNRGRYALDDPQGYDLTAGDVVAILIAGRWREGTSENGAVYSIEALPHQAVKGYYFITRDGERCGLCIGMQVRLC